MASEPTYRFELAKTARAGCQNSACKKAGIKIQKGEFRMGTLVTIKEHTTFMWKHWGCVTPAQIQKLQDQVGPLEDLDDLEADLDRIIDGYDEIDDESREKIKYALIHGHVADEDWKGEPELNRPGMKGINRRTPKKKEREDDEEDVAAENEHTPSKPKAKRGKKTKVESEEEEDLPKSPAAKKKASRRKVKDEDEDEDEDAQPAESPPPKKAGGRKRKVAVKEEDSEAEAPQKPPKRSRAKKVKAEEMEKEPAEPVKPEKRRKKKGSPQEAHDDEEDVEPSASRRQVAAKRERTKTGRKAKAGKHEEPQVSEEDPDDAPLNAQAQPNATGETEDRAHAGSNSGDVPEGYIGALRQDGLNAAIATNSDVDEDEAGEAQARVEVEDEDYAEEKRPKAKKSGRGKGAKPKKNTKGRAK